MTVLRILVFDDLAEHAQNIVDAARTCASSLNSKNSDALSVECVWFSVQARPDYRDWPRRVPMIETEATVFRSDGTQSVQSREWWQGDFQGAVIDEWNIPKNEKMGITFLNWLGFADFDGPVCIVSSRNTEAARRSSLAKCITLKKGSSWEWCQAAATYVLSDLTFRPRMAPIVGSRGRNPTEAGVLREFFAGPTKATRTCRVLWAGHDDTAREKVHAFIPNLEWSSQGAGFCWKSEDPDTYLTKARDDLCWFVCVDLGTETATDAAVTPIITAVRKLRSEHLLDPFVIYLLADRVDLSKTLTEDMYRNGLVIIGRSAICDTPGLWLEDTMEGLAKAWNAFNDLTSIQIDSAFLVHKATVVNRLVEYFLRATLVAHGKDALCGGKTNKGSRRSMGRWFASTPHSGSNINQTFKRDFGKKVVAFCTKYGATVPVYLTGMQTLLWKQQERTTDIKGQVQGVRRKDSGNRQSKA